MKVGPLLLVGGGANLEEWRKWFVVVAAPASGPDLAIHAVEEGVELVIFLLRNGIILMVVTLSATNRETEEDLAGGVGAVHCIGDVELIRIGSSLLIEGHATVEP